MYIPAYVLSQAWLNKTVETHEVYSKCEAWDKGNTYLIAK